MRKNVSGQHIGAQMVDATTGGPFTGSVTVYVTGDAGTQAVGSVGAGSCAHEGNGFHTYNPAQAETNYDHIGFTFIGTGAVPATVQVFTSFPQTGDSFARLGAPAGASFAADVAGVAGSVWSAGTRLLTAGTNIVLAKGTGITGFNDLSAAQVNTEADTALSDVGLTSTITGRIDAAISTRLASAGYTAPPSANAVADQVWDEILSGHAITGSTGAALAAAGGSGDPWATALPGSYGSGTAGNILGNRLDVAVSTISGGSGLTAAGVRAAIGLASANLDTQLDAIPTAVENADTLLNRDLAAGTDTGSATVRTVRQALRFLRNKWALFGTTLSVKKEDDATESWSAVVTTSPGADPISGTDPAGP